MMSIIFKKIILALIRLFFSCFGYKINKIIAQVRPVWPKSDISCLDDKFLLLLTLENSGSTAIGAFICQSNNIYGITKAYEALWLLIKRELWTHHTRCAPHEYINYKSLAGILSAEINKLKQKHPKMEYVFEKTPDNACRYKKLLEIIPNTKIAACNRNPYAQIASALKRKYIRLLHDDLEEARMYAHYWLVWSEYIREACEKDNVPLVTYEQFCDNPDTMISAFGLEESEFKKDFHVSNVKDYAPQAIENMNEKQIALLSDLQKETITEALSEHKELLAYFGYELMH